VRHPVVVVGAGPVGLSAAIDLAQQGVPVVLLDDDNRLSTGSRAICFAKRTLEIFDRLGCGQRMVDKGVTWNLGKVFFHEEPVYGFNLLPEAGHRRPAFINLQQYYVEGYLFERARALPNLDIRWKHQVTGLEQTADGVSLTVATPEGEYGLRCDWLVAADGARSPIRKAMGLESKGRTFRDRFLIADVRMEADFPAERWFWFDPPFHPNQSCCCTSSRTGCGASTSSSAGTPTPVAERQPDRVIPAVQALLGRDTRFDLEWVSVYTFACLRMERFRHGRVLFAGDSAHGVSPFGARGANSGVQDADNLAWKLRLVVEGQGAGGAARQLRRRARLRRGREHPELDPEHRLHHAEERGEPRLPRRHPRAGQGLRLRPPAGEQRPAVHAEHLPGLAPEHARHRRLRRPHGARRAGGRRPGACPRGDGLVPARARRQGLRRGLFQRWRRSAPARLDALRSLAGGVMPMQVLLVTPQGVQPEETAGIPVLEDAEGLLARRYDARPGTFYLLRPDQHVCARWRRFDPDLVRAALARAAGNA
jgi:3-(3-hydroxy-phenyl)propionate hydroxylase